VLLLPEVFGEVEHPLPEVEFFYSDIPCKILPSLKKYDPELYQIIVILLGAIHRVSLFYFFGLCFFCGHHTHFRALLLVLPQMPTAECWFVL